MQPVIVGIDPGTTSAFAVLSFDFKVIAVKSRRNYSFASLVSDIYRHGNPIIVGTDKKEMPGLIKDFSQKTGAKVHLTRYDTKKGEKKTLVKEQGFSDLVKNAHETDALASAIYAFNDFEPLVKKIKKYVEKKKRQDIQDKLLCEIICKEKSIARAVSDIDKPQKKKSPVKIPVLKQIDKKISKEEKEITLLSQAVKNLKTKIKKLEQENKILKQTKIDIDKETKKLISFKEQRALAIEKENRKLKKELRKKSKTIDMMNGFIGKSRNSVLVKKLKNLSNEEIRKNLEKLEKDDILLIEDISVAGEKSLILLKDKIKILIKEKGANSRLEDSFIIISKDCLEISETKYYALINQKELEKKIAEKILQQKKEPGFIKDILEEYKRERLKDIV